MSNRIITYQTHQVESVRIEVRSRQKVSERVLSLYHPIETHELALMTFNNTFIETTIVVSCCPVGIGDEEQLSLLISQWLISNPFGYLKRSAHRLTSDAFCLDFYLCIKNRHYQEVIASLQDMIQTSILPSGTTIRTQGSWLVHSIENRQCYELIDELRNYMTPRSHASNIRLPEAIAQALCEQRYDRQPVLM